MSTTEKIAVSVAAVAVIGVAYLGMCAYCVTSSIPKNKPDDKK